MKKRTSNNYAKIVDIESNDGKTFISESETDSKGSFSYTDQQDKTRMVIHKSLGTIGGRPRGIAEHDLPPKKRELSSHDKKIVNSKSDVLGKSVLAQKGDPSYEKVVDLLPPLAYPYTFLGDREYSYRPSPRIDWDGSIRGFLGFGLNGKPLAIDLGDMRRFEYGLLDGYLPAIQFQYVNEKENIGWEEIATAKAYPESDNTLLVFLRLKVKNLSDKPRQENISIFFQHFTQISGSDALLMDNIPTPDLYPTFDDSLVEQPEYLWVSELNDCKNGKAYPFGTINRSCRLRGGEEQSLYLILAYTRHLKQGSFERMVPKLNFYRALFDVKKDWDHFLDKGMRIETPEPRVDNACKATLIQGFMTVVDSDVKYAAAGRYAHKGAWTGLNGLPIAMINAAECFSEWGFLPEVKRYLAYYLKQYVEPDGTISYKNGTGGYDYGLLLFAICRFYRLNNNDATWVKQNISPIKNLCDFIVQKRNEGLKAHSPDSPLHGLIAMISCDDLSSLGDKFYNYATDACCWLGLMEVGKMLTEIGSQTAERSMVTEGKKIIEFAEAYKQDILASIKKSINYESKPVFIPIFPGDNEPFPTLTDSAQHGLASFANVVFYPPLLYSNILDEDTAAAIIRFREKRGGEVLGTSRLGFSEPWGPRMDDWPIASLGWALINLDKVKKFLLTYYGDLAHHRMRDIFCAYEQVGIADGGYGCGRTITAGINICSTLATARMAKYMLVFEERDKDLVWLNRATPETWLEDGKKIVVKNAPTRWGKIGYCIESHVNKNHMSAQIEFAGPPSDLLSVNVRLRHPTHKKIRGVTVNGKEWESVDINKEIISIPCPNRKRINIEVCY